MLDRFCKLTRTPVAMTVLVVVAGVCIRLLFMAFHKGMWGVDGGAYLLSRNWVLGNEPTGTDFTRPWLAPGYLLVPFTAALGDDWGIRIFHIFCLLPMMVPFWMLARQMLTPWQSVFATACVMMGWMLTEMFTAGALPMLGFCALFFAMWGILKLAQGWQWRYTLAVTLGIAFIPYLNQTTVGIAAYVLPVWMLGIGLFARSTSFFTFLKRLALPLIAAVVLAIPAYPFYFEVAPGSGLLRYPGPLVTHYTLGNAAWYEGASLLIAGVFCIIRGRGAIRALSLLMLVCIPISCLVSFDESVMNIFYRTRYLQTFFFFICAIYGACFWVQRYPEWKGFLKPVAATMTVVLLLGHLLILHTESKVERMVTPQTAAAIEWINSQPDSGTVVTNSYSLSLYVSALTQRKSAWSQVFDPPPAYAQQHKDVVCIFGWMEQCDVDASLGRLGASYLLVDRTWPSYSEEIPDRIEGLGPVYRFANSLAMTEREDCYGYIWDTPPERWDRTETVATWLTPVWEAGQTKVWSVAHLQPKTTS
jgi:hypothetical protein